MKHKSFFPIIVILLIALKSNSTINNRALCLKNDSILFEKYLQIAISSTDSADFYFKEANKNVSNTNQVLTLTRFWARNLYLQNNLKDSEKKLNEVLDQYILDDLSEVEKIQLSHCYVLYDYIFKRKGEYELAIVPLKKAIDILEKIPSASVELIDAYNNMGVNYRRLQEYETAISWFSRVLKKSTSLKLVDLQVKAYGNLGMTHLDLYQTQSAKEYYHLILDLIGREDVEYENIFKYLSHHNLGMALQAEAEFDSAVYHYDQALLELRKMPENFERDYTIASVYGNLGKLFYLKESLHKSLEYSTMAMKISERLMGDSHVFLLDILRNIGDVHLAKSEIEHSKASFLRALKISKVNSLYEVNGYNSLGDFHYTTREIEKAIAYYDSAILKNRIVANNSISYTDLASYFLSMRGKLRVEFIKPIPDIEKILALYDELTTILSSVLKNVENRSIIDECTFILEKIYLFFVEQHNLTEDDAWVNRIWEVSEISKAVKLKGQLKDQYSLSYSLPDSLLKKEKNLKDSINLVLRATKSNEFDSALFILSRKYEQFIMKLERDYPKYHKLKNTLTVSNLPEVLKSLGEKDILLNFFEGKENVFLMKVSKDSIKNIQLDKIKLNQQIDQLNKAIFDLENDSLLIYSEKILSLLELDIKDNSFDNILIHPDGITWKLNFAALGEGEEDRINFLGNQSTLSFSYYYDDKNRPRKINSNILAFSYNEFDASKANLSYSNFRNLDQSIPGTSKEIISISKIWNGEYYFGKKATESEFKLKGEGASILHLATHGYQNERFPENSYLQFSTIDSINDGKLHSYEIYNLNLNANLAVLSACNSGKGKVMTGEGMMSMAQAFSYAGVASTIASRWEVPDVSAPFLMKYLYEGLREGMKKSEALKYAQIEFLKNDADNITSNPFYWSGLYVIGNDDPISLKRNNTIIYVIISFIILGLFLFLGRRKQLLQTTN